MVIDHLNNPSPGEGLDQPAFQALLALARHPQVRVKLSGFHHWCRERYPYPDGLPFAEAAYLVGRDVGPLAEAALVIAMVQFQLEAPTTADLYRMAELMEQYADWPLGAADASIVALAERLYIAPKIVGGITLLDPAPLENGNGEPITFAPNAGVAIGIEYATNMDHFTIGLDIVLGRFIIGPNIFTMQFFPRVKYTF